MFKVANRAKIAMLAGTSLCLSFASSHAAPPGAPLDPWVGWYAGGNIGYSWGKTTTEVAVGPLGQLPEFGGQFPFPADDLYIVQRQRDHWRRSARICRTNRTALAWRHRSGLPMVWTERFCSRPICRQYHGLYVWGLRLFECSCITARLNYFRTFRGRAGPEINGVWLYGTAGFAFGKVSVSGNNPLL